MLVFPSLALVVAVHGSGVGCPGIAVDHPPTFPAEELSGKGETHVLLEGASDVGEGLPPSLCLVERFFVDELRAAFVVDELRALEDADVLGVGEYLLHEGVVDEPSVVSCVAELRELFGYLLHVEAVLGVEAEYLLHDWGFLLVCDVPMVHDLEPEGEMSAVVLSLEDVLVDTSPNLLRQLDGVELVHALDVGLDEDAYRPSDIGLGGGDDGNTVLLEELLVLGAVSPVPGEPVVLPDEDGVEPVEDGLRYHPLEAGPVRVPSRLRPVDVLAYDIDAVLLGVLKTLSPLGLDGFLPLALRGVSEVEDRPLGFLFLLYLLNHLSHPPCCLFYPTPCSCIAR